MAVSVGRIKRPISGETLLPLLPFLLERVEQMLKVKGKNSSTRWKILILVTELVIFLLCGFSIYVFAFERSGEMQNNPNIILGTHTPQPTYTNHFVASATETVIPTTTQTGTPKPTITLTPIATLPKIAEADCIPPQNQRQIGQVIQVVNGNTIIVNLDDGNYPIRYIGIDAPGKETGLGKKVYDQNVALIADKWVTLIKDVSETDQENQLLRYVFVGDIFINYELIRQGYVAAKIVPPDSVCGLTLHQAQRIAQKNQVGIWKPTSTPWPTAVPTPSGCIILVPCDCSGDIYNCGDFKSQQGAQGCFNYCQSYKKGDIHNLDPDGDGIACENLP